MWKIGFLFFLSCCNVVLGRTIPVSDPRVPNAIRSAIANARSGDTIVLFPGHYHETDIPINKPLTILGKGKPIVDGQNKNEIFVVNSDDVQIEGLHVMNGGYSSYNDIAAIRVVNASRVRILRNEIENTYFGIYVQHCTDVTIVANNIHSHAADEINSANGIHCWKSDGLTIFDNTVTGHRDGIYFEFVTGSHVKGNRCFRNVRYGLHFMFSNDDRYEMNLFSDNGAGVAVMFSHRVIMRRNQFLDNWGEAAYGLLLKEIADGDITGNRFERNSTGILMEGTNRMDIKQNQFKANGWAFRIQASCDGNNVTSNNFSANSFDVATNGSLVLNHFSGNYWDKYEGYDLDRNGVGDVPYRPLSIYSMIVERNPAALMLFRSFMVGMLERSEKWMPGITPEAFKDISPSMKPLPLNLEP